MKPFTAIASPAAWLDEDNIDTDAIFPARFLLLLERDTLGPHLFHDRRYGADGAERADFILNQPEYRAARVLVAGHNFGCGSSREHAVWTLLGHGIGCVIAISFGEIFRANAIKNGLLPIQVSPETAAALMRDARALGEFRVDLESRRLRTPTQDIAFAIADAERDALLNGWDEVAMIARAHGQDIAAFEARHRQSQPWLFDRDLLRLSGAKR